MKVSIYSLSDPDTGEVRYVGKSIDVKRRFWTHCREQKNDNTHRARWIAKLLRQEKLPMLTVIEVVEEPAWQEAETKWIAYYRGLGCSLVNSTDGGDGGHNPPPDVREKIGMALRGKRFSESHRGKIAQALKGRVFTADTIAKMGAGKKGNTNCVGRKLSEETRRKISASRTGKRVSEEVRLRMKVASTGRIHTAESIAKMREVAKRVWQQRRLTTKQSS